MAAIDQDQLYTDTILYLPESNVLPEVQTRAINASVVQYQIPEDDDIYYSEALCKCLKANAVVNRSKYLVDDVGKKREKVGQTEIELFEGSSQKVWDEYIKGLSSLCPYLPGGGYSPPPSYGIIINSGDMPVINDCPCPDELHL